MPRATYNDLIKEVRAQIAVDDTTAYAWLLDRSRVLNAEASWLVNDGVPLVEYGGNADGRFWGPSDDQVIWIEAVWSGDPRTPTVIYRRSTPHAMDARSRGGTGNTSPIYCDAMLDTSGVLGIEISPAVDASTIYARAVMDVYDERDSIPPFPTDFDGALVDGAVAVGLARMDERFDSASYMDQRFQGAIGRLRRRRHARIGRGATAIRVVQ